MVRGTKVRGSTLDAYDEYVIDWEGNRHGVPGTERHRLSSIQEAIDNVRSSRTTDATDTPMAPENKRGRSDTTESEQKEQPDRKKGSDATPSLPNSQGESNISPDSDRETHLINPESRRRNSRRSLNMDDGGDGEPMAMLAMASSESVALGGKARRAIMPMYTTPKRNFFEDRVVVALPVVLNFSVNKLDRATPVVFRFQLNDTYEQYRQYTEGGVTFPTFVAQSFPTNGQGGINQIRWETEPTASNVGTLANPADNVNASGAIARSSWVRATQGTINDLSNRSKGISRDMAFDQLVEANHGALIKKPVNLNMFEARQFIRTTPCATASGQGSTGAGAFQMGAGALAGDIPPDYRDFYEALYQVRHVHACNWKMTVENASSSTHAQGVCMHKTETLTNGYASASQNVEVNKRLHDCVQWPSLLSRPLTGRYSSITGQWRSDTSAVHHDVVDADEIKDWYQTGAKNGPAGKLWEEFETFLFYADATAVHNPCFNVRFEAEWIVEYRDLKRVYRNITRESAQTTPIGTTGTLADLYTQFTSPTPATNWPSTKQLALADIKHVKEYLTMDANSY